MARSPIEIGIASDTRAFKQGVDNGIIKPLEDAEKQLKDLGNVDAGRDIDRDLGKAQDATKDLSREIKRTRDDIEKMGRSAKDAGDEGAAGFRKLGDKGAEVGGELKQNLGETFSSFRGDLKDLPQIAQDTLGGLAGSGALGGIPGLAATAAGAAGLGLIIGAMDQMDERSAELKARANEMAQAFIEAGSNVVTAQSVAAATADVITDEDKRKRVQAYADALGVDFATAARAYVGDSNAMAAVDAIASKARDQNIATAEEMRRTLEGLTPAQQAQVVANQNAIAAARELGGVVADANNKFEEQQQVLIGLIRDSSTAAEEVDGLGNKLYTLPDNTKVMISADTGQATTDVSKFQGDADGVIDHISGREAVVRVRVDDKELAALERRVSQRLQVNVQANVTGPLADGYKWQ